MAAEGDAEAAGGVDMLGAVDILAEAEASAAAMWEGAESGPEARSDIPWVERRPIPVDTQSAVWGPRVDCEPLREWEELLGFARHRSANPALLDSFVLRTHQAFPAPVVNFGRAPDKDWPERELAP